MNRLIIVIGGGISGISNAIHLKKNGYSVAIIEKHSRLGGIWANGMANKTSHLQTPSFFYNFTSGLKWKSIYPYSDEILQRIDSLHKEFSGVEVYLNDEVISLVTGTPEHTVLTKNGLTFKCMGIVIATGIHQFPHSPSYSIKGQGIEKYNFNQLDIVDPNDKKCVIVGLGASAVECHRTLINRNPKSITFITRKPRWIYPNNFIYSLVSFLPLAKPGQLVDKLVHNHLKRFYKKKGLIAIEPIGSPAETAPGSISSFFFKSLQKVRSEFFVNAEVVKSEDKKVYLSNGIIINDVDIIIFCTGWSNVKFPFICDEKLKSGINQCQEFGYFYLHEFVPGYDSIIFSNYKSGIGYTGFAPYLSSMLIQCSLEVKNSMPSEKEQWNWIENESKRWKKSPKTFQFINMFESVKEIFIFFSSKEVRPWLFKKFIKRTF